MQIDEQTPLIKSGFLRSVQNSNKAIIWHSLFGYPKVISIETLEFINIFKFSRTLASILEEYEIDSNQKEIIMELIKCYYLIPENFNERKFLAEKAKEREQTILDAARINYLELIVSEECNFRCSYCIHFSNLKTSERINSPEKFMHFNVAKKAVDNFLKILRKNNKKIAQINFVTWKPGFQVSSKLFQATSKFQADKSCSAKSAEFLFLSGKKKVIVSFSSVFI